MNDSQRSNAEKFRELHAAGAFVLPNAWDAVSAALVAQAGAPAVATTSAAVSWALGRGDGQRLTRAEMIEQVRRIAATVPVPVTADVEGGYGPAPADVAATVEAVIAAGAVGVNLEDSTEPGGPLFSIAEQATRLRAGRAAAGRAGLPALVINARTDVYLFGIGEPEGRQAEVLVRAEAYAEAGADALFVPGLLDLDALRELAGKSPLPINVMVGPGAPTVPELAATGVRRISLGPALAQAAYATVRAAATELLAEGGYAALGGGLDFGEVEALFAQ
ncbi:isocitrate lyase/PEP mutase family protein [Nocardia terpenica]|uniref:3-methyl-2-oxobutanoate hydroxymethyltransferase n=1 Tax=Nocardia terpenica TaxID=455432 RepID=A0A164NM66_9NOCA|nr:isocitrate lyase/phosphoenolpyruvate mutase family protein [Nocardia terpenica]KZM74513.1 3-methyl-2-oxobutanoate hydroxymethyltransferase [Nocardia terpenica]NQE92864.1 isocitrate lyase/phosphoenolpyruvate mutase family protein [Nocardia terpenica]